jgi:rubrerythrin
VSARGYVRDLTHLRDDRVFEEEAVKRYGHMAAEADDPALKALFAELTRAESGHRRGLRQLIQRVEDPSTSVVFFCPLCGWEIDFGPEPKEGAVAKCRMCPGKFALRLTEAGDWSLERLEP